LDAIVALLDAGGVAIALFDDGGMLRAATRRWRALLGEDGDGAQVWQAAQRKAREVALEGPSARPVARQAVGAVGALSAAAHGASTMVVTTRARYRLRVAALAAPERGAVWAAVHLTRDGDPADAVPAVRADRHAPTLADTGRRAGTGATAVLPMNGRRAGDASIGAAADAQDGAGEGAAAAPTGLAALTVRERAVAILVSGGVTLAVAARELGISVHTARHHLERVYAKLSVRTRVDLSRRLNDPEN
jgi:DNA-binding CsgD family transcriptional regulator